MHHLANTKAAYMYPHDYSILVFYTTEVNSTNFISKTAQSPQKVCTYNPYPTAFPYGNGMVLHFYQQQESSTTKTVHKVINKGLKTYV